MSKTGQLSHEDIKSLMNNPNAETKIKVIEKLSGQYNAQDFTEAQVRLAEQIFRLLLKQAEIEVRKALSDNLMSSKVVPHDVVFALARDVEEVALPVLEFSEVLSDDDLVEIIKTTEHVSTKVAISGRSHVSENVSSTLVDTEQPEVVNSLLQNDGAEISEKSYTKVIDDFAGSEEIVDSLITRGSLSSAIVEQMTQKVSGIIQKKLEKKYQSSFADINTFFKESGEVAALKFMSMQSVDKDLLELIDKLEKDKQLIDALHPVHGMLSQLLDGLEQVGQLTPLSALTVGHYTLFEICLSRHTGVPFSNVRKLVADRQGGLKALYERAQLPLKLFEAVQFILGVIRSINQEADAKGLSRANDDLYLLMKRIMTQSRGKKIRNLAHFISAIRHHIETSQGEW